MEQQKVREKKTHFGYQEVPIKEKEHLVGKVFTNVANKYDLMNDLMSLGIHRFWKKMAITTMALRKGHTVLDVAGGTGDLTRQISRQVGEKGRVILTDINNAMLIRGRERLIDEGIVSNLDYIQSNAECLPFSDNTFDRVSIAFGLRNVTDKDAALRSMFRILKPGGQLMILEFSKPTLPGLEPIYNLYSFKVLPFLGKLVANDEDSYRYLAESIRMHPNQHALKSMMCEAGFERCDFHNLSGGIVAIHKGYKL